MDQWVILDCLIECLSITIFYFHLKEENFGKTQGGSPYFLSDCIIWFTDKVFIILISFRILSLTCQSISDVTSSWVYNLLLFVRTPLRKDKDSVRKDKDFREVC